MWKRSYSCIIRSVRIRGRHCSIWCCCSIRCCCIRLLVWRCCRRWRDRISRICLGRRRRVLRCRITSRGRCIRSCWFAYPPPPDQSSAYPPQQPYNPAAQGYSPYPPPSQAPTPYPPGNALW